MKERFILSETVDKEFVMETAIIRICRHIRFISIKYLVYVL